MRILRELPDGCPTCPMPPWKRGLCAVLLVVSLPLWAPALLVLAGAIAARTLLTKSARRGEG